MSETEITVAEMQKLCAEILDARDKENAATEVAEELGRETTALEMKLLDMLEKTNQKGFKAHGMNFIKTEKTSVRVPAGDEKLAFFEYLRSIGQFEGMITVNSNTLNSWYKSENDKAKERGEPYATIPGVEIPTTRVGLTVRKT